MTDDSRAFTVGLLLNFVLRAQDGNETPVEPCTTLLEANHSWELTPGNASRGSSGIIVIARANHSWELTPGEQ